jgi:hypothetical protein
VEGEIPDPSEFGLNSRTVLKRLKNNHIAIVINRKSRIIMKDGESILEKSAAVKKKAGDVKVSLVTDAPVCSRTAKFLAENGIDIIIPDQKNL